MTKTKTRAKNARPAAPARGRSKSGTAVRSRASKRGATTAPPASESRTDATAGAPRSAPLITRAELRRAVFELASTLAPADITDLLAEEESLRAQAAELDGIPGDVFRTQLDLALTCLHDHAAGRCPQIPFYTISLLTAGIAYLADDMDLIPDFLPDRGTIDDALVLAMACTLGESGLRRYCTWKGIDATAALGLVLPAGKTTRGKSATR